METIRCQLPTLMISSYETLIKALKYYQVANNEFIQDEKFSAEIYIIINYIEENSEIIKFKDMNFKYQLPTFTISTYFILIEALKFYRLSSVEFVDDTEILTDFYEMIDFIMSNSKFLVAKK